MNLKKRGAANFREYKALGIIMGLFFFGVFLIYPSIGKGTKIVKKQTKITGKEVAELVKNRPDGKDRRAVLTFTLINKRNRKRKRKVLSIQKDEGDDTKAVMCFLSPGDVKNTIFLQYDYDNPKKEDDKWLYLPALRRVKRISGSKKSEYFMGTDFTYDDLGDRSVEEDEHRLVGSEVIDGHDCWIKEAVSKDKDYMYSKVVSWIRKDIHVPLKVDFYDRHKKLLKTMVNEKIKQTDGFWTVWKMKMENFHLKHKTFVTYSEFKYNQGVKDSIFSVSNIKKGRIK